jgi:hypothetical protein
MAHVFEVDFELPERCICSHCKREAETDLRLKNDVLAMRDLDLFGPPSFWIYQLPLHQCPHCRQRTQLLMPFKRPRVTYTSLRKVLRYAPNLAEARESRAAVHTM